MDWLIFIASTLACFRLTRLVSHDKIFDYARKWIVREAPRKSKKMVKEGITCSWCVSFYWAAALSVYFWRTGLINWQTMFLWMSAIWGGSVLWNSVFTYFVTYSEDS